MRSEERWDGEGLICPVKSEAGWTMQKGGKRNSARRGGACRPRKSYATRRTTWVSL